MVAAAVQKQAASVLHSFPFRAAVLALCVALLPLLPTQPQQAPDAGGGVWHRFLTKAWELLHLLVVGIAVSYGLFSRRNDSADDGRGGAEKDDAAAARATAKQADHARYASRVFRDSIAPFDDEDDDVLPPDSPVSNGGGRVRSWSALHRPDEPVVVLTDGGGGRSVHAADAQAPLSLPVRTLRPQPARQDGSTGGGEPRARPRRGSHDPAAGGREETVLPSPLPWRSRSRRFEAGQRRSASPSPSPSSPKRLSPVSSSSRETLAKATEEYNTKRRSPYKSSAPPAPPPPPPPFLVHCYHPASEHHRRAAKSFKEELQDHSTRGRGGDHFSPNTGSFGVSGYNTSDSSPAKPNSFDGSSSSSSAAASVARSVRTYRAMEPAVVQDQSQDMPDDAGDGRDALDMHGPEEPYGFAAYQSIPRFQYERSGSDPILGGVAVSSDETESSDDDDDGHDGGAGGASSTRESTPEVDENEVDKKAEEFIARFREQIRRQRIESIKKSAGPRGVKHGK